MTRKAVVCAAVGAGVAALAVTLLLSLGFRLFAIQTPSMGETAPVGTLVVTRSAATYGVGEIISFERGTRTYTHRIIAVGADGGFTTKGDLNGAADPLPVAPADVIGRAVWIAPGLGWVLQGLPWLALGVLAVFLLSLIGHLDLAWRWAIRLSGWSIVFCLVALWLRPWVNLDMLGYVPADDVGVLMHVVNTGLFPVSADGSVLVSGQDTVVHVTAQNAQGFFTLTPTPALEWWQHVLVYLVCLVPLASALLIKAEPTVPATDAEAIAAHTAGSRRGRLILIGAIVVAVAVAVAAVNQASTLASLTGSIKNSTNTAGTRTYLTCASAVSSTANPVPYLAWALGTAQSTSVTEADLSGNGRTGRYMATATVNSSVGCPHDSPKASAVFDGASQCVYQYANYAATAPAVFSVEAWFMTTSTALNGKIIGLGTSRTTSSETTYDRQLYLDKDGRVVFGIYDGGQKIIASPSGTAYNDGNWHHIVGTFSTSAGMSLYVDGSLSASATQTSINSDAGYWKVGCGTLSTWADGSGSTTSSKPAYFKGQIQYAAVYTVVLTAAQVKEHYLAGNY